jgi:putative DNA methylase
VVKTRKKLIEVALPLEAINVASAREKSIRHGHPSTLHLWWARRPLAAARAVIFAQMVDDPSEYVDVLLGDPETRRAAERELKRRRALYDELVAKAEPGPPPRLEDCAADLERQRLFRLIEQLVQWENTTNEDVLQKAREEIWASWRRACADNPDHPRAAALFDRHRLPGFHDPFAGGGTLPLEAQRLGLEAHASDLNPVAVLINKAMIEIPPCFANRPPVHPGADRLRHWKGAQGLAEDVRYYGRWMRDEAERRIGHLYPEVEVTAAMVKERPDLQPYLAKKLTVVAWLWARTVHSPNPAFANVEVPLVSTFMLSTKAGREAWVEPVMERGGYCFKVRVGTPKDAEAVKLGTTAGKRGAFRCVMSGVPVTYDYIRSEGQGRGLGTRLMAIVAEGQRGRVYLSPTPEHEATARQARPAWTPDTPMPDNPRDFKTPLYGLTTFADLFTGRQLVALATLSDLVSEVSINIRADALAAHLPNLPTPLRDGGDGTTAYAEAVGVYLAFALSKLLDRACSLVTWFPERDSTYHAFGRQALPMSWDFAETNVLLDGTGSYANAASWEAEVVENLDGKIKGFSTQIDAQSQQISKDKVVSTDPPYYDNIGYADLSDFFYVWLRRALRGHFPDIFSTLTVPKSAELVATPYRHGGKEKAEKFFLDGMTEAMRNVAKQSHPTFPVAIYYAVKQSETRTDTGTASTGWETFLDSVINSGLSITGTWPMRTELSNRLLAKGNNALASSIVLVCRSRPDEAPSATRRELLNALKSELPSALRNLQKGNIAPVDLAQAAIGPGMAVFSRYARVLDAEGRPLSVRDALALINATLDEVLAEQEGDFDADSRWALAWFEQNGFAEGDFGVAEVLSKAKVTSVAGLSEAGIVESRRGKVRLRPPAELPADWDPSTDPRLTAWEMVHQLIRALEAGGEAAAASLVAKLGVKAEVARELAYRLYVIAERKKRATDALSYNGLVQSWPEINRLAREGATGPAQGALFAEAET